MVALGEATQSPLVSVILPTYNRPHFLEQAIRSVLAQSYIKFELIIINDGSSDRTAEVVASFNDKRIRYIFQANSGRSSARNHGIHEARGKYIAFLDDDDLYFPEKLETQVLFLENHPEYDLVAGGAVLIDSQGKWLRDWPIWLDTPKFDLLSCVSNCCVFPSVVMVRSDAVIFFDESAEPAEDTNFFIQIVMDGRAMAWDKHYIAYYRQHEGSSQHNADRYKHARLYILDNLYERSDIPEPLLENREKLYAYVFLTSAFQKYKLGNYKLGSDDYNKALILAPELSIGNPPKVLESVAAFAGSFYVHDPKLFIRIFWQNLPDSIRYSPIQRCQTMSIVHMQRVFKAHANNDQLSITWKDWFLGVMYDPRWLLNRGVLRILVKALLDIK